MTTIAASPSAPRAPWHCVDADQVATELNTSAHGLAAVDAARRLALHGRNELKEAPRPGPWILFFAQFKSLIIWILIVAGLVSGALGEWTDAAAILAIVLLNAAIGFYQEYSAEKSIAALRKMTAPRAKVRRDGKMRVVPASEVVPGDVIELEAGDLVPADARLLRAVSFKCVEAALTGESEAVDKRVDTLSDAELPLGDRSNMVFLGTSIGVGTGEAIVVATGMRTELGRIAGLIETAGDEETPLQKNLDAFGRLLVWGSLGIVVLLFALGLWRGMAFMELFLTAVSLAVAAVPEGLPAVVTVALALGVMRMSRRRALVRKIAAVETLGSTNVICTDKTGTLTVGEMTVRQLWTDGRTFKVQGEGYAPSGSVTHRGEPTDVANDPPLRALATNLVGCNNAHLLAEGDAWKVIGDPTEGALLAAGRKIGLSADLIEHEQPRVHEIPFDSDRKRRTVVRSAGTSRRIAYTNGAPDVLLEQCTQLLTREGIRPLTVADRDAILRENASMAGSALRVLGCAVRECDARTADAQLDRELVFVGLAGLYDPPRTEAKDAVAQCRGAGIRVVMITGDHPGTALVIARELGIASAEDLALSGVELNKLSDDALREAAPRTAVYARVTAEHKLRIIRAWKATGATVAMTGDGVNDAPAIKGADIGVAMGRSGTEVTKQAADIIITDDNFASIVAAVEEGRGIYDNIRKTLQYLLAGNCGELLLMAAAIIAGFPVPLLAIHLLWINLVTDGLPALCLASDPIDPDVMRRRPRARNERITDRGFLGTMMLTGALTAGVSFGVYLYGLKTETLELARTHAFAALVFAELLRAFGARSETKPLWRIPFLANVNLALVVTASFLLQVWSHHSAALGRLLKTSLISISDCVMLITVSFIPLLVIEFAKLLRKSNR